jgi:hypothetical protein
MYDSGKHWYEAKGDGSLPEVFNSLPDQLHTQLSLSLKLELVTLCPLFNTSIDMQKSENKRAMLFMFDRLVPSVGIPHELVAEQGQFAHKMFFLTRGVVGMMLPSTGSAVHDKAASEFESVMSASPQAKPMRGMKGRISKNVEAGRYLSGGFFGQTALLQPIQNRKYKASYKCHHYW